MEIGYHNGYEYGYDYIRMLIRMSIIDVNPINSVDSTLLFCLQ